MVIRIGGKYSKTLNRTNICDTIIYPNNINKYKKQYGIVELQVNNNNNNNDFNLDLNLSDNYIESYHLKLPNLPKCISAGSCIYNRINDNIYCVGGRIENDKILNTIYSLNFKSNYNDYNNEWNLLSCKLKYPKHATSLCLLNNYNNNNHLISIGGYNDRLSYLNKIELINLNKKQNIELKPNILKRMKPGCLHNNNNKIIIGGGYHHENLENVSKSIEIYDIIKEKCTLYPYLTRYQHSFPYICSDIDHNNLIYIIGDDCHWENSNIDELGIIEYNDLRSNQKWCILNYNKNNLKQINLKNLFGYHLKNINKPLWRARNLLVI